MAEIVASFDKVTSIRMKYKDYISTYDELKKSGTTDSLWMLEKGQVLILETSDGKIIDNGFRCYLCGRGYHADHATLETLDGNLAICKDGCGDY